MRFPCRDSLILFYFVLVLYLSLAFVAYYFLALPQLEGLPGLEVFADSETYTEIANSQARLESSIDINSNYFGPVLLLRLLCGDHFMVFLVNIVIFVVSLMHLRKNVDVRPLPFLLLLAVNPIMLSSLTLVNKEIFGFAAVIFLITGLEKKSKKDLVIAFVFSFLMRWQMAYFVILFLCLEAISQHRVSRRLLAVIFLLVISVAYPFLSVNLFKDVTQVLEASKSSWSGSGLFYLWNDAQELGLYALVFPFKFLHLAFGLIPKISVTDAINFYNGFIVPFHSVVFLFVCLLAFTKQRFAIFPMGTFMATVYAAMFALSPIYSPRYFFPMFIMICIIYTKVQKKRDPNITSEASSQISAPLPCN